MTDNTQDLLNRYLVGGKSYSDGDEFELESDPWDDPIGSRDQDSFPSPPTPHESPLKAHLQKLRGSPVKISKSPLKPQIDNSFSRLDDINIIDSPKYVTGVPEFVPSTGQFDLYQRLLASSTQKLMAQLETERRKNKLLETKIATLHNDKFKAQVTQGDYDLLKREYATLLTKFDNLQGKTQLYEDTNLRLEKENQLLREKLIKYKKLYEDLRDRNFPHDSHIELPRGLPTMNADVKSPSGANFQSIPEVVQRSGLPANPNLDQVVTERAKSTEKEIVNDNLDKNTTPNSNTNTRAGNSDSKSEIVVQAALEQLLQMIAQRVPENNPSTTFKTSEENPSKNHSSDLLDEYNHVLSILAHNVEQIGLDLKQINTTLKTTEKTTKDTQRHSDMSVNNESLNDEHASQNDNSSNATSIPHHHNPDHDYGCQPATVLCAACSSAASRLRPISNSATKGEGHTQMLMGRYMWNRTT